MAKDRPSIRDVARESGVSLTTVSLILNRNDERISDSTRQRVLRTMERLSYTPSRLARGLPNRRANTLAVLVPALQHALADVYFGEIISGIYETAADAGFRILLEVARPEFVRRKDYLTLLDDCSVDGILFVGATAEHEWLQEFDGGDRPIMIVNNHFSQWALHNVTCDYAQAGRIAADYLVDLGHERIGYISGPAEMVLTSSELADAFISRLHERGIDLDARHMAPGEFRVETGREACTRLLQAAPDVTAIFAANDKMAIGAYQALRESGLKPGADISVLGCDDIPAAVLADPPLSTIRLNFFDVGMTACTELLALINRRDTNGLATQRLPVSLVERSSCHPHTPAAR